MPIKDLLVGRFSNGVVTLINDQKVDSRQVEEIVIEGIQKHLVNHDQNLQRKNKTLLINKKIIEHFEILDFLFFISQNIRKKLFHNTIFSNSIIF